MQPGLLFSQFYLSLCSLQMCAFPLLSAIFLLCFVWLFFFPSFLLSIDFPFLFKVFFFSWASSICTPREELDLFLFHPQTLLPFVIWCVCFSVLFNYHYCPEMTYTQKLLRILEGWRAVMPVLLLLGWMRALWLITAQLLSFPSTLHPHVCALGSLCRATFPCPPTADWKPCSMD